MSSILVRPDGAKIAYQIFGNGPLHVLLLSRGGMRSSYDKWSESQWDPIQELVQRVDEKSHKFRLIGMDQRMSKEGDLPGAENHNMDWSTFVEDQIALLDHLSVDKCHAIIGSCIGPSYALLLMKKYPQRFDRAVLLQPIGLAHHTTEPESWEGLNTRCEQEHWFGDWAKEMEATGRASRAALDQLHANMFVDRDFCFSVTREQLSQDIPHPLLLACGVDRYHPAEIAREMAKLSKHPKTVLLEEWRDVGLEKWKTADAAIRRFLLDGVEEEDS